MKKLILLSLFIIHYSLFIGIAHSDVCTINGVKVPCSPDPITPGQPVFRANIQSTSVDWEAVTGLRLSEFEIRFTGNKAAGNIGWEMYYLDDFPCYGSGQWVRTWLNSRTNDALLRMICLSQPRTIRMAYRQAARTDSQGRTTGMLTCKIEKNLTVDLSKCTIQTWAEFDRN